MDFGLEKSAKAAFKIGEFVRTKNIKNDKF